MNIAIGIGRAILKNKLVFSAAQHFFIGSVVLPAGDAFGLLLGEIAFMGKSVFGNCKVSL